MIYIRTDANRDRGMGHLYRMLTLADRLVFCRRHVKFVIRQDAATEKILKAKGADYLSFPSLTAEDEIIKVSLADERRLPELWIFDLLDSDEEWVRAVKEKGVKAVSFDDTKGALEEAGLVINSFAHSWGRYKKRDVRVPLLEGLGYSIINPNALLHRKKRVIAPGCSLAVAITMGGSDCYGSSLLILKALAGSAPNNSRITLFTGPNFSHYDELSSLADELSYSITVRRAVSDLHRELDHMDVIICSGGITLLEVCAMGLPALAFATESHEEKNIRYLSLLKGCLSIGSIRAVNVKKLSSKIRELLADRAVLNETAASAMRCVGSGTDNCVQAILDLVGMHDVIA